MRIVELGDDSRQILCERCRKFVPISHIKYLPKGNDHRMALCKGCLASFGIEADTQKQLADETKRRQNKPSYFCTKCKYKFKYDENSHQSLRCPYCGKADKVIEDKQLDAASILKESDDF